LDVQSHKASGHKKHNEQQQHLVDTVQMQRLTTEPQEQGQELEAEGGVRNEAPSGVAEMCFPG